MEHEHRIFCQFGPFLALLHPPPNNPKNQNFEKTKKTPGDFIILHMCTINDPWFPEIWSAMVKFFSILDHFLPFYPTNKPKNKNFEKMKKKPGDIIILHMCTRCVVPENGTNRRMDRWTDRRK